MTTEKLNFDDIVRNLLVFLKGQVPSLQGKKSIDELTRQVQAIIYMLRTSIIQLEGAAFFDPRNTPEFKSLSQELDSHKKTSQRLEESLFLEMNKTQKLTADLDKLLKSQEEKDRELSRLKEQYAALEKKPVPDEGKFIAERETLNREIARLHSEMTSLERLLTTAKNDLAKKDEELARVQSGGTAANQEKAGLEAKVVELEQALADLRNAPPPPPQFLGTDSMLSLKNDLEKERVRNAELEKTLKDSLSSAAKNHHSDRETIRTLQGQVEKLQHDLTSSANMEVLHNMQSAAEAKIAFLEKSLSDLRKNTKENAALAEAAPLQIEAITKEKLQLEQRIIDLEAIVRRLSAHFQKGLKEAPGSATLGAPEYMFFFEILNAIMLRLSKSPENKDIRQKAEEAIQILEKHHAIEPIATVGSVYEDRFHKVVRAFQSHFLEDGTIVFEAGKGFRSGDQVVQRAVVWVAKTRFKCADCGTLARTQDNFCPKCGMELCAPDGTTKRRLPPLPATIEICIPLIDHFIQKGNVKLAQQLQVYVSKEQPDHPAVLKRGNVLAQLQS